MKTTPFYELSVALRGRSLVFKSIVLAAFISSIPVAVIGAGQAFSDRSKAVARSTSILQGSVNTAVAAESFAR